MKRKGLNLILSFIGPIALIVILSMPIGPLTGGLGIIQPIGGIFDNGAPACAACHGAGGFDQLRGSGLGPDLTHMYSRFGGEQGTAAALAIPPSATMTPLFADNPLTETEIADLTAFFAEVDQEEPGGGFDMLWIWGLAVLAALLGFLALFVSKPSGTYLDKLRSST